MNAPRRGQQPRRRRPQSQKRGGAHDLWRPVPALPEPDPITPAAEPTALLDSLGSPPLRGNSSAAEYYLATVVERAAALATALAASAGLLAESDDD